jgi:very-short-patch-repair endonuclease
MPAKRSNPTPKEQGQATRHRAGELRREMTPAEQKLWAYLRGNKLNGVSFRRHTCPGGRRQGHTIGNFIVDFVSVKKNWILSWMVNLTYLIVSV